MFPKVVAGISPAFASHLQLEGKRINSNMFTIIYSTRNAIKTLSTQNNSNSYSAPLLVELQGIATCKDDCYKDNGLHQIMQVQKSKEQEEKAGYCMHPKSLSQLRCGVALDCNHLPLPPRPSPHWLIGCASSWLIWQGNHLTISRTTCQKKHY